MVSKAVVRGGNVKAVDIDTARRILGESMVFDADRARKVLKPNFPLADVHVFGFDETLLRKAADHRMHIRFMPGCISFQSLMEHVNNQTEDGMTILHNHGWVNGLWSDQEREARAPIEPFSLQYVKPGWCLVSDWLPNPNLNYLGQTQLIRRFVRELFCGEGMPTAFARMLETFDNHERVLMTQMEILKKEEGSPEELKFRRKLAEMPINRHCRESAAEVLAGHVLWTDPVTRPLGHEYVVTNQIGSNNSIVRVGGFLDIPGGSINAVSSVFRDNFTGVRAVLHSDLFKRE